MERPLKKFDIEIKITGTDFVANVENIPAVFSKSISLYCESIGTQFTEELVGRYVERGIDDENYNSAMSSLTNDVLESISLFESGKPVNPTKIGMNYSTLYKLVNASWSALKNVKEYKPLIENFKDRAKRKKK
jgi:hypothetical protein